MEKLHQKARMAFSPLRVLADRCRVRSFRVRVLRISYHLARERKFLVQSGIVLPSDLAHGRSREPATRRFEV